MKRGIFNIMRTSFQRCSRAGVCGAIAAALLLGGCMSTKKFYEGAERAETDVARLQSANSYVFSINGRRTDAAKDRSWTTLVVLPGTQRLIVQLDEDMASRYGHVGVRFVFCARAGHSYTVYPVTDIASRTWQPAARDDATGVDVEARSCEAEAPARDAPAAAPAPAPAPKPVLPPTSAAAAKAAPATVPPAAAPPPAASPAPSAAPPSPPVAAAPPSAAAPVTPPPGVLAAGAPARLKVPARTRSLPDAPPAKGLEAGMTVTLKVMLKKDTGAWWYVTAPAGSGWAREAELEPVTP